MCIAVPSPLVGEGSEDGRRRLTWVRGSRLIKSLAVDRDPHPALRATFSHKGRRKENYARSGMRGITVTVLDCTRKIVVVHVTDTVG